MRRLPLGEHNLEGLRPPSSVRELIAACDQVPFLCEKRMVIARGIVAHAARPAGRRRTRSASSAEPEGELSQLAEYVPHLPTSTHLVLVEDDAARLQPLVTVEPKAVRKDFPRLRESELPGWIVQRTRQKGAQISRAGATELAELVGADLRSLDTELDKLATYVQPGESIEPDDVRELVAGAGAGIFAFHDAVAER